MPNGVLVDLTKCIGCRGCQVACKQWNGLDADSTTCEGSYENPQSLKWNTYTKIRFVEGEENNKFFWGFIKMQCMHCKHPACVSACPVGSLKKSPEGPVTYDKGKCIGCRYCMVACPFNVPTFEWNKAFPLIRKCTFCVDRVSEGKTPSCVKTCPSNALKFGDYDVILKEAEDRINNNPDKYINYVYGKNEVGGTSWLYISGVSFDKLGFKVGLTTEPLPSLTWKSLAKIPYIVGGLAVVLSGLWFITSRKEEVSKSDKTQK
jgi:formate dehydrogenase iron-sulfur subunit